IALLTFWAFVIPKKAVQQQRETAAGATNDNSQIRIAIEDTAGDHAQDAFRDLSVGKDGERDPRSSILEPFERGILGKTGAVQKDGPSQFGNLAVKGVHHRQIQNHFTVYGGVQQSRAKALCRSALQFLN